MGNQRVPSAEETQNLHLKRQYEKQLLDKKAQNHTSSLHKKPDFEDPTQ